MPHIVSVNVGSPRPLTYRGRTVMTSIYKEPVQGRVDVRGVNIEGDIQSDLEVHGGRYKAIYAYASEDYEWWSHELDQELGPGAFGENLTTQGLDISSALIGERWRIGAAVLEVTQPRFPCFKLGAKMGTQGFVKKFAQAQRTGSYLGIVEEGEVGVGDGVEILSRPDHDVTIGLFAAAYLDRALLPRLLEAPSLPPAWRALASERGA